MIAGIDPGLTGGVAILGLGGELIDTEPLRFDEKQLDHVWLKEFLDRRKLDAVAVEKVHAMPGQGVVSMFGFGRTFGAIEAVVSLLGVESLFIPARSWTKGLGVSSDKLTHVSCVEKLWPNWKWTATARSKKPHLGMIDAALIAKYALNRRQECKSLAA